MNLRKKFKLICFLIVLWAVVFVNTTLATEDFEVKLSDEYNEWDELTVEEKEETIIPQTLYSSVPDEILSDYIKEDTNLINNSYRVIDMFVGSLSESLNSVAAINYSSYNLADYLSIRVDYQGTTTECWAVSTLKALETNIAIINGETEIKDFSERHMDYATARDSFTDGTNSEGLARKVSDGGLPITGLAYLTNGQGAVLEEDMPFEDNDDDISLSELDKEVNTIVTDYVLLPTVSKTYTKDSSGNTVSVTYYNSDGEEYTESELEAVRQIIKEHIVKYGGIATMNGGNYIQFYNNQTSPLQATAYNCNDSSKVRDHAVTIVGWDDNYSKDNFAEGSKPSTDGAYIVLNSYGSSSFDNGYLYISYEDYFVESELYGIQSSSEVDYDEIYQYDFFGGIYQIGSKSYSTGYYATTFERDTSKNETLNSVGVTIPSYATVNIYVNPNGTSLNVSDLVQVASVTDTLEPGYHRIDITPIQLVGSEFAIVVEQTSLDGTFYFSVEACVDGTAYSVVTSENRSYYSVDGENWANLASLSVSIDTSKADVCIKGFVTQTDKTDDTNTGDSTSTEDNNTDNNTGDSTSTDDNTTTGDSDTVDYTISSDTYVIDDKYIMAISYETSINTFLSYISGGGSNKTILESDDTEVTDTSSIIKTGMKLKLANNEEYTLIVRGDIKEDGKVTLTDVSKIVLHYNEMEGFILEGNQLKAADMNYDGEVNLVDVSQMIVLYNSI